MTRMLQPLPAAAVSKMFDRERMILICDCLAVGIVAALPWSTSATSILLVVWLIALVPSLDAAAVRRELLTPAGGLPVVLWGLGVLGMLWADVSFSDRVGGLDSFHKLLFIPLMLAHFRRSDRGSWVLKGFLLSCGVLLIYSWILIFPLFSWSQQQTGVPVRDYIAQSALFTLCIAIALDLALMAWRKARVDVALAWIVFALLCFANILFVATSRTALIFLPFLLLLFGLRRLSLKGIVCLFAVLFVTVAAAWSTSWYLRDRVSNFLDEIRRYQTLNQSTSAGERLEYWKKSLVFIGEAPVIGHGTGSIREKFTQAASGSGASALVAANPHNQTFAVAIQLGLVGSIALFAMWMAHLMLFRGEGFAAWVGLVIVLQNMVGSLFNSHLFDFAHGWGYVMGVGIAGGIVLANRTRAQSASNVGTAMDSARVKTP